MKPPEQRLCELYQIDATHLLIQCPLNNANRDCIFEYVKDKDDYIIKNIDEKLNYFIAKLS